MYDRSFPVGRKTGRIARESVRLHKRNCTAGSRTVPVQVETVRLYPTRASQCALNCASEVRHGRAELLGAVASAQQPDSQNGRHLVRISIFYRITAMALVGTARPAKLRGLGVSHKWAIIGTRYSDGVKETRHQVLRPPVNPGWTSVLRLELKEPGDEAESGAAAVDVPPRFCDLFDNDLYFGREAKHLYLSVCRFQGRSTSGRIYPGCQPFPSQ